ncbi:conserved Plasmodium protein, unknown function [Plasmodium knowlesi strain H]|uniref:WD repeat-containing protein n=3 Tax=Plasmodium knowlesi TaxID=5850 RepID=A0A5K1VCI8_PLAKH|nr:WD repeat-containing protein, putative [Plasmodium knowlesi strain H]OTN65213.1 Uncharacterized protein PKNOH_S120143400 [Plasmodium knowlesi]CAA9988291.1 WD repeat-containing protein, putative [Plasmodium knowlesi strain H]SBO20234.1 conserved Plasmodium protein, unknown function [Plasmodium knowlesi strain H]SBO20336.1 conserved Plasmodium protein, unknown function [Plasmodium knowlesi strain H]VVS77765.1 WD repeat-containing protein, putative [Plasmodium knowlesi strain H]|eukprot:XP_002259268.1 hypothetical protein, conserved in Plasmodium species [Plasmodium knowlesi strain H]
MGKNKAYVSQDFREDTIRGETKEQEKARIEELNQLEEELAKNEYTSKLHKELLLQNANFNKEANLLKLHLAGNLIKNKPILSRKNVAYLSSESGILLIDLKRKKKKKIVTSFFIDNIFYFLDKKTKQEYLVLKTFNNYIYLYQISERKFHFVKKFFIKNLFYINSFGKNGELCFATWDFDSQKKKMFMNFYLLKFVFNYESPLCYLNGEVSEQDETNTANGKTQGGKASSPTHVTYTFSSDSEDSFNNDVFPCELMVTSSDGEEWEMMKPPPFEHLNGMPMQNGNRYYANQRNGFFPRDDETTGKRRKTEMNSQKESPNERKQYMHVSAKVKIMPLLKIKYVYFSMVDMNPSLTKLVLANNNLVIIYDTVKRRYNLMYFKNVISTIKISDENFLCIGFLNGFIDIFLFDQVMQNDQDSAEDMLKRNAFVGEAFGGGKGSSRKMNFMLLLKAIQNAYPYIPGYEVAHYRKNRELDGEVHGEMHGDMGSEDEGEGGIQSSSTIPYIDFRLRKDKIVDMQKVHVVKYKWHSHAVYDITIDGRKVISCGEEAVVLIYDIDSGVNEYIPHLGSPCYYSYVNKEKNLIICSSLKNTIHFINYNHRLFFYSYVGLHMPLSLRHLFSNYVNVYESIKNSVKIFEGQICSLYNYSLAGSTPAGAIEEEEGINGGVLNGDASMNPLANCDEDQSDSEGMTSDYSASSDAGEGIQDGITSGEKSRGNLTRGDHRSKGCEREEDLLGIPDEGIELSSSGEDQQGPLDSNPGGKEKGGKKTIISFKEIQEDIERSIYNHTNVQNNLYKKYQMLFYCDSNKGLVFSFLTSFSNIQLYNVEKDKHVKFVCPLQLTYKSRSSVEAVNDLELLFFSFTQSRHLLMTIERRNYQLEEACENKDEALVEAFFTFKIWRIVSNKLDYEPIYEQSITCEKVTETHEQQGRNEQEPPQNNCREDLGEEQLEKYRMIINHPFLSIFLVLECEGDMNVWCLEKSERIFDDTVYTDYEVDVYQTQDNSNYYRETRRLIHLASVYAGDSDDCNQKKSQMCQPKEDYEKEDAKEGEEGDQGDVNQRVTVIKRINHKNHPILGGDITSDGKILCICHDKIITIWDLTTLRVMAIINHTIYTGLNEFLFRLYKGVEIIQTDTDKGETKGYVPYMCFFAFDTIFIYSLYEFHLVYQKKIKNGIIEYVKFDKYNCSFVAIGVTKRLKGRSNQRGSTRPSTIVQKNYLYEFTSNVLKKRKLFYSSRDRPIVALDFAPLNERKNIPLSSFQPCTMLVALNSKFQVCTFYINTYAEFMELS